MTKKLILPSVLAVIITLAFTIGCGRNDNNGAELKKSPVKVTLKRVEMRSLQWKIHASATLEAKRSAALAFLQGGYLTSAGHEMGDAVDEGDTLAMLDTRALKADVARAEAAVKKARRDYRRAKELYETEVIPKDSFDDAETGLISAEAVLEAAKFALDHGFIIAPFKGKIAGRFMEPGQIAPPGAPVYRLIDSETLEMTVGVAEREIIFIRVGDLVEINPLAIPGITVRGRVTALPPSGELSGGLLPVKVECRNPGNWLPGLAVRTVIAAGAPGNALTIPGEAVRVSSEGEAFCYKYRSEKGDVLKTPIQVKRPVNGVMIVNAGVDEGDLVVCGGIDRIRDGDRVTPVDALTDGGE